MAEGSSVAAWPLKPADIISVACSRLRLSDLPAEVWQKYFSGTKPGPTCGP